MWHDMNVGMALIFGILETDGRRVQVQGCDEVSTNFRHEFPQPMLLLHVEIVEAGDMAPGSHKNMAGRHGLRSRDDDSVLARGQSIVWRSRAEEAGSQQVSTSTIVPLPAEG